MTNQPADQSTKFTGLWLEPLDVLFFRDGRPFDASSRVASGLPNSQTVAGCLRQGLLEADGFEFHRFRGERRQRSLLDALKECGATPQTVDASFRGPWLAFRSESDTEPLFPMPTALRRKKTDGKWSLACRHDQLKGWRHPDDLIPMWHHDELDGKADAEFVTLTGLRSFLEGGEPAESECYRTPSLYQREQRTGNEINKETLTTADGQLYGVQLLALFNGIHLQHSRVNHEATTPAVGIYAECDAEHAEKLNGKVLPLGGEGRAVRVHATGGCKWPAPQPNREKSVWYLATPTFLERSASGYPLPKMDCRFGAISGNGVAVSGLSLIHI